MSSSFECDRQLVVQAELDGELDAAHAVEAAAHRAGCAQCAQLHERLERSAAALRGAPRFAAPASLRTALRSALASAAPAAPARREAPPRRRPGPRAAAWIASVALSAAAASLATLWVRGPAADVSHELVDSHLRALQSPAHLLDVASTEHHVVRPWFAGQLDFAPPVKDLAAQGYPLRGARVDVIEGRPAAVLVYEAGRHTIDVFVWPRARSASALASGTERGFHVRGWDEGDLRLTAVSDLDPRELENFVGRWNAAP